MIFPIYPKYDKVIHLSILTREDGVLVCINDKTELPGMELSLDITKPYLAQVCEHFDITWGVEGSARSLTFQDMFIPVDAPEFKGEIIISTSKFDSKIFFSAGFLTFPELLRGLDKNRLRIFYLKAWQCLLGVHKEVLYVEEEKINS